MRIKRGSGNESSIIEIVKAQQIGKKIIFWSAGVCGATDLNIKPIRMTFYCDDEKHAKEIMNDLLIRGQYDFGCMLFEEESLIPILY